ncbi:prepilin-type N-terminal cleavage/methylation domain-containing protein [Ligilactobacillus sp. MP3]|uniref:prepilin-type N-terminal cleavage/methylation domain-containing protein n=1 Tax=Ligilactobacillus sp. MP3 TaxID=2965103 RepID=UPI00351E4BAB
MPPSEKLHYNYTIVFIKFFKYIVNNFRYGFTLIEMAIVLFIQNKKACRSYPHTL